MVPVTAVYRDRLGCNFTDHCAGWLNGCCFARDTITNIFIVLIMEAVNQKETTEKEVPQKESKWYVLRVVSGKERKVKEYLDKEISRGGWGEIVKQVFLPVEKVVSLLQLWL